jgi:uncharacterized protein
VTPSASSNDGIAAMLIRHLKMAAMMLVRRLTAAVPAAPAATATAAGVAVAGALRERLREDLKVAMRARDKERSTVVRAALSAITYADKATGTPVDDDGARAELRRLVKKHEESITQFTQAGRADLAAAERAQLAILQTYLPRALDDGALRAAVDAAIGRVGARTAADLGTVMRDLTATLSADAAPRKPLTELVKARLAAAVK